MKQWKLKQSDKPNLELLEYPSLISKLLALRGFTDASAIHNFLEPDFGKLHSPFLFGDMQKAVERISAACDKKEKIRI